VGSSVDLARRMSHYFSGAQRGQGKKKKGTTEKQ